jgi:signal transduction histidine kinase
VEIRFERRGHMLHTIVADRGFGISDDEPLFEPFYRSRIAAISAPGLGLGLTVCKRLVEVQGGEIWARRRAGGGAEFAFSLPLHREVADS